MGVTGLALAFSIDNILEFVLLWIWLSMTIGNLDMTNTLKAVVKLTVSAIAAGGAAQITKALVWPFIDMTKFSGVFISAFSRWIYWVISLFGFLLSAQK